MRITMEPTNIITKVNGVVCRLWRGKTNEGTDVVVCAHQVVGMADEEDTDLDRYLLERPPPKELDLEEALPQAFDMRLL